MGFKKDSRGQIFSIDLLLALIPLTLIIGMAAADMDNILYLTQGAVFQGSTERAASDAMHTLLETSGDPVNWELLPNGTPNIPGLANYDTIKQQPVEGTINSVKLFKLNPSHMNDLISNESYGFFLNVSRSDGYTVKTLGTYNSSAKNVVKVERLVLYRYLNVVSSAEDLIRFNQNETGQPKTYNPPPFPTNKQYLDTFDYWAVVVNKGYNSATVLVNNTEVIKPSDFNGSATRYATIIKPVSETILYNETDFKDNVVTVTVTSNPWNSMNVYIVQVPKGTPESEIVVGIDEYQNRVKKYFKFQLYLWVK